MKKFRMIAVLCAVLALMLSFTTVAYASGGEETPEPTETPEATREPIPLPPPEPARWLILPPTRTANSFTPSPPPMKTYSTL